MDHNSSQNFFESYESVWWKSQLNGASSPEWHSSTCQVFLQCGCQFLLSMYFRATTNLFCSDNVTWWSKSRGPNSQLTFFLTENTALSLPVSAAEKKIHFQFYWVSLVLQIVSENVDGLSTLLKKKKHSHVLLSLLGKQGNISATLTQKIIFTRIRLPGDMITTLLCINMHVL